MTVSVGEVVSQARHALDLLPVAELATVGALIDTVASQVAHATAGGGAEAAEILAAAIGAGREAVDTALYRMTDARDAINTYLGAALGVPVQNPGTHANAPAASGVWGHDVQRSLPQWTGGATVGVWRQPDGMEVPVRSGAEPNGIHVELARFMAANSLVPPHIAQPEGAKHVELKTAFRMRQSEMPCAEVAINKEVDTDMYGCDRLLPFVLKPGQTLIVHHPRGTATYMGRQA